MKFEFCSCDIKFRLGNQPRAVGKRTPRFPVQYSSKKDDGENYASPIRKGRKSEADNEYDVAKVAALLTEASHRGGSPRLSQTPYRRFTVQSSQRMVNNYAFTYCVTTSVTISCKNKPTPLHCTVAATIMESSS